MGKIYIKFDKKNKAKFQIETDNDSQLFTALLGLQKYVCKMHDLPMGEIQGIIDEMSLKKNIKPIKEEYIDID